jgi:hypothetical protein
MRWSQALYNPNNPNHPYKALFRLLLLLETLDWDKQVPLLGYSISPGQRIYLVLDPIHAALI